jgi:TonB family protein
MKKSIFALMLVCYCFCSWAGQEGVGAVQKRLKEPFFEGVVGDFVNRSPISGASVAIEETGQRATTDQRGVFQFEGLTPGSYTVRITHPQYRTLIHKNYQVSREGGAYVSFPMKSRKESDSPLVIDDKPKGQFVIDEDAEVLEQREPIYPQAALKEKVEGTVVLWVGVGENGEAIYAGFKEGLNRKDLVEASMEAIQYFKFKPAKVKGKPVEVMVTVPFNFKLADKSTPYPLDHLDGPLTSDDVEQALAYLGVELERFAYELPYKHKVKFWVEQYRDGKLADTKSGLITPQPGRCSILIIKHQYTDSIRYTLNVASGNGRRTMIFGNIPIRGYNASGTQRMTDIALRSGVKVPIYLYALSPEGVSFNFGDPIDRIIARIKLVIVISVELNLQ